MTEDAKIHIFCGRCAKPTRGVDTGERDDKGHMAVRCTKCNSIRWVK